MIHILKYILILFVIFPCMSVHSQTDCVHKDIIIEPGFSYEEVEYLKYMIKDFWRDLSYNNISDPKLFYPIETEFEYNKKSALIFPMKAYMDTTSTNHRINSICLSNFGCERLDKKDIEFINEYNDISLLYTQNSGFNKCPVNETIYKYNLNLLKDNFWGFNNLSYLILGDADSLFTDGLDTLNNVSFLSVTDFGGFDFGKFPNLDTLKVGLVKPNETLSKNTKLKNIDMAGGGFSQISQLHNLEFLKYYTDDKSINITQDSIRYFSLLKTMDITNVHGSVTLSDNVVLGNLESIHIWADTVTFLDGISFLSLKTIVIGGGMWREGGFEESQQGLRLELPKNFKGMENIQNIEIKGRKEITNLKKSHKLEYLKSIYFYACNINEFPYKVGKLDSLREVSIIGCNVSSKSIVKLINKIDHPVFLQLSEVELTDDIMNALANNKNITHLRINAAMFNSVEDYSKFKNIEILEISTEFFWYNKKLVQDDFCISNEKFKKVKEILPETEFMFFTRSEILFGDTPKRYLSFYGY